MARNSKLLTAKEAKNIDIKAKEIFGISTLLLMENAGKAVAEEAVKMLRSKKTVAIFCGNTRRNIMRRYPASCGNIRSKMMLRCATFCGKGNNGGDGFVVARQLLTHGIKSDIFLAGKIKDVKNEARTNLEILLKLREKIIEVQEDNLHLIKNKISKYDLIIDALLGVGLAGEVRDVYRDLIGIINTSKAYILSIDIPSGLDATKGKVLGCCVKADKTVTFVAKKRGMVTGDGPKYCGRVVVKDLGIPLQGLSPSRL